MDIFLFSDNFTVFETIKMKYKTQSWRKEMVITWRRAYYQLGER